MIQRFKDFLRVDVGLSSDAVLVLVGVVLFLGTCLIARQRLSWAWALVPGICVSLLIEGAEIVDAHTVSGLLEKEMKEIVAILFRHGRDFMAMNLGPILIVIVAGLWARYAPD